jgi:predicted dehydrogenase
VHGTHGSFVKEGLDAQEDALKAGRRPAWPAGADWGRDPGRVQLLVRNDEGLPIEHSLALEAGDYMAYYVAVAAAIRREGPNPVPAEEALDVMALIEAGLASDRERRELVPPLRPSTSDV